MTVKLIVFDYDGVLFDMSKRYAASYIEALKKMGLEVNINQQEIINFKKSGMDGQEVIRRIVSVDASALAKINGLRNILFREPRLFNMDTPVLGLNRFLTELKRKGIKTAILTARQKEKTLEQLNKYSLLPYFDRIVAEQVPISSCNGEAYVEKKYRKLVELLEYFKVIPSHAVYIGDTEFDMKIGRKAGVATVGVLTGLTSRAYLEKEKPDLIIEDVTQLKLEMF